MILVSFRRLEQSLEAIIPQPILLCMLADSSSYFCLLTRMDRSNVMAFATITTDIILVHILPHLTDTDIRSLAQCNHDLATILGPLRFKSCSVRRYHGCFSDNLSPSTIKTIRHLSLDGLASDHDEVFSQRDLSGVRPDLSGVVSATIVTMIEPNQRATFGIWARQLQSLREEDLCEGEDPESSLSNIPAGWFENLQELRLDVALPLGLENTLCFAKHLRRIQFLPTYPQSTAEEYMYYLGELNELLNLVSDTERVPALKVLHIGPTTVSETYQKAPHRQLMLNIWAAVHRHGGWKLECTLPETFLPMEYPHAWEWWWARRAWDLTITVKEAKDFTYACEENNIYPRLADFVKGRIQVQTAGGTPVMSALTNANIVIYGLWIHHGPTTDITAALKLVSSETRMLAICLRSYWGSVGCLIIDTTRYQELQGLLIDGPSPGHLRGSFPYETNYGVAFVKALAVTNWTRLLTLSLPAMALQKAPKEGVPYVSQCGLHVGGYDMEWLAEISTLKALFITQWFACTECNLAVDATFDIGLTHVPSSVEFVSISGRIGYRGEVVPEWVKSYPAELRDIMARNRFDVLVSFRKLFLTRIGTDDYIP